MFKRRRKDVGTAALSEGEAVSTPASTPPPPQHRRAGSASMSTTTHSNMPSSETSTPNFDFDFLGTPRPFAHDSVRPQTSDGVGARSSSISLEPPMLPPIPRISSTREGPSLLELMGGGEEIEMPDQVEDTVTQEPTFSPPPVKTESALTTPVVAAGSRLSSFSRPTLSPIPSQKDYRESPSSSTEAIKMEPSLFPTKAPAPQPRIDADEPMSREFIDSRDKPYTPAPRARPQLATTNSSPDLRTAMKPTGNSQPASSVLTPVAGPSITRPSPKQFHSAGNVNTLMRPPSNSATNYSGTTARSTRSSKSTAIGSDAPVLTVGTPYQETSQSYPLPQHVRTRPKTAGAMASIGGVNVPTHHTSSLNARPEAAVKPEKRKTKLLNPMLLLSRRRAGQEDEALSGVRVSSAQALQRQRNVAAEVNKIPEDFDPRIKGNVVHDFSAPRESRRMFSYNDALDPSVQMQRESVVQSSSSAPFIPAAYDDMGKQGSVGEASPRRSVHTPVFTEHLSDDVAEPQTAAAAIQAEKLENKAFLNRASLLSQDSSVLPPFARRSQHVEPLQTSNIQQESTPVDRILASKNERERDSHVSTSSSGVSPITQRNSALPGATDVSQDGVSPVSPTNSDRHGGLLFSRQISRPVSEVSRLGSSDGVKPHRMSEVSRMGSSDEPRPMSTFSSSSTKPDRSLSDAGKASQTQMGIESIAEEQTPKLEAGPFTMPERPASVARTASDEIQPLSNGVEIPPRDTSAGASTASSRGVHSPLPTPATQDGNPIASSSSPPNLAQRRADAVGRTKRSSSGAKPRHNISNASRFSFQFGESAVEELALEEKARKLGVDSRADDGPRDNYDDDDYFDEDAMDDMDEMEVEAERAGFTNGLQAPTSLGPNASHGPVSPLTPTFMPMVDSHDGVHLDDESDGVSEPDSYEETPYWLHDALRSYTHTREPSAVGTSAALNSARASHAGAQSLTIDTNLRPNSSGFYMHPGATTYSPSKEQVPAPQKPPLPHRDSGNSERNRVASGLSFGGGIATHKTTVSGSTVASEDETTDRSFNDSSAGRSGSTEATGLGLSGFSGFKFIDTPDASRPTSFDVKQRFHSADRRRGDSETLPQDPTFATMGVARSSLDRDMSSPRQDYNDYQYDLDDMYFDDGGFDAGPGQVGDTVDEDAFDDDGFLDSTNRMGRYDQSNRQTGDIGASYLAVVGDGPYPSFAQPNSARIRERDSRLMLEDLPLHAPVDPKLIPRRNPSEDAKRLGLSDRVPPLPAQGLSAEAAAKLQNKVHAYHAILAEAAQKAFAEGRFGDPNLLTIPSRSDSVNEQSETDTRKPRSWDDRASQYSRYDDDVDEGVSSLNGNSVRSRKDSTFLASGADYSPAKMSFDFGFDSIGIDDSIMDDGFGSDADDDIVAAANAEVLANDDDGFYGQEFGFYAKARPNSGEVEAINGGFFGLDGDDGLSRQRSMKEPNLTPITELSEFSRRTSFIGPGMGGQMGTQGIGSFSPVMPAAARLPVSPWIENEVRNLRKLKANAFGGSSGSLHSSDGSSGGGMHINPGSAPASGRTSAAAQGYFGLLGSHPMTFAYSNDSSASSNPPSAHPQYGQQMHDSPQSAVSGAPLPFANDPEATPKRPVAADAPVTAVRKISDRVSKGHSRNSSGADSVTYVREQDPDGQRPPRWVLEKRRTSEAGQLELVAREVVQDGWI